MAEIFNKLILKYANASLTLVGGDSKDIFENTSTLKLFLSKLNEIAKPRVKYLSEVTYDEIKNHIAKAHVVVLPSFAEAFPMTWLETLAMQKPLVASNIGWAKELMIHEKTGLTVNPTDHEAYADAILSILLDDKKSENFAKNGRRHVCNNFATSIVLEENVNLYKQIIKLYSGT